MQLAYHERFLGLDVVDEILLCRWFHGLKPKR
jgi:hypothetical protein